MKKAPSGLGTWIAFPKAAVSSSDSAFRDFATKCSACGIRWLAVKTGDADLLVDVWKSHVVPLMMAAAEQGIGFYTWNYSKPWTVQREMKLVEAMAVAQVDGHIIDAEVEWVGAHQTEAAAFVAQLRKEFPDMFLAHAPLDHPLFHPTFPWKEFGALDAVMPQFYWSEHSNEDIDKQWLRMKGQWDASPPSIQPIWLPVGVTYGQPMSWGNVPGTWRDSDLKRFLELTKDCPAPSLYTAEAAKSSVWYVLK